jgi:D-alanyl-D-alanine carboxypeptidase
VLLPAKPTLKHTVLAISLAVLAVGLPRPAHSEALLLIDVDSGKVLEAENATYPWYPASTTKLMTAYVILNAVKQGRITTDTLFTVSATAVAQQPTKMGFRSGTQVTVDNALKMMMVHPANDMAVLLAEGLDGSIESFGVEMTEIAHRLGMTQSNFVNPNGLPAEAQITSARDLAILARALIRDFPEYGLYWRIPAIKLGRRVIHNTNALIDRYPGMDGMKTGFICASGYNLVASATHGGKRLIAVVLGAHSSAGRALKAVQLLEKGFNNSSGLSWLLPSLGTVDGLSPIAAAPPDLHEEICGGHKRRPSTEMVEEEVGPTSSDLNPSSAFAAIAQSLLGGSRGAKSAIADLQPSMPPVAVFVGPPHKGKAAPQLAASPAPPTSQSAVFAPAASSTAAGDADAAPATRMRHVPLPRPRPAQ